MTNKGNAVEDGEEEDGANENVNSDDFISDFDNTASLDSDDFSEDCISAITSGVTDNAVSVVVWHGFTA